MQIWCRLICDQSSIKSSDPFTNDLKNSNYDVRTGHDGHVARVGCSHLHLTGVASAWNDREARDLHLLFHSSCMKTSINLSQSANSVLSLVLKFNCRLKSLQWKRRNWWEFEAMATKRTAGCRRAGKRRDRACGSELHPLHHFRQLIPIQLNGRVHNRVDCLWRACRPLAAPKTGRTISRNHKRNE